MKKLVVLLVAVMVMAGCGSEPPKPVLSDSGVENIIVEEIIVENIIVEEIITETIIH